MESKPIHIAIIPDGNRRYMRKKGIGFKESYEGGIKKFYDLLDWCNELGVKEVTIYALSLENIENRNNRNLKILLDIFLKELMKSEETIHERRINVRVCGDREKISELNEQLYRYLKTVEDTSNYDGLVLNLAIAYGGRQEIINAINLCDALGLPPTEENLKEKLWVTSYPDIIIRTAERRLSNFLTFQGAYSEIYFVDKLWQEFEREDLEEIVKDFNNKERRFGE